MLLWWHSLSYFHKVFHLCLPSLVTTFPHAGYISDPSWNNVICTQNFNISIRISIVMLVCSSSLWSDSNLFWTTDTDRTSYIGTFVNKLTTSKFAIQLLLIFMLLKCFEFLMYDQDIPVCGLTVSSQESGQQVTCWSPTTDYRS